MERWRRSQTSRRGSPDDGSPDARPTLLRVEGPRGPVVLAADAAARTAGVAIGARVADVLSAHPGLRVEAGDPDGDRAALVRLAGWARRWCPWTAPDPPDGIVLDLTGSDHLHGGPAAALADLEGRLADLGLSARAAIAPSWGGAWALARHASGPRPVHGAADLAAALAPLPVHALRLVEDEARLLRGLGLRTVGALAALPRAALARRFRPRADGTDPLGRLDRAMGRLPEPIAPSGVPPRFAARARLPEPVLDLAPWLPGLAEALCADLAAAGHGARRLRLTVFRADGDWRFAAVDTAAATREPPHLVRLLERHLDRIDPGPGFDLATLEAVRTEALGVRQVRLDGEGEPGRDLAALVDRLVSRLGRDAVAWTHWRESHLPERVEMRRSAAGGPPPPPPVPAGPERPIRLLDPPEEVAVLYAVPDGPPLRFRWRAAALVVVRRQGPERIAPEWWRARPGARLRDYWKVEVEDGRRLWLFREGLHGDGRGGDPRWFLHGLFA